MYREESRTLSPGKKVYFASDFHLGIDGKISSIDRERLLVRWLSDIREKAEIIFLVGDIFDYWFEYKRVVPKGFVRILGKLAELSDSGIEIIIYTGNHDMWMFQYMQEELGAKLFKEPVLWNLNNSRFIIGHGDGLGPGDFGYKVIKKIFNHPFLQWCFARIHPNTGIWLMKYFSGQSRAYNSQENWDEKKEWLVSFCEDYIQKEKVDYFIFGHRHLVIDYTLSNGYSRYLNIGDWYQFFSFGIFDGQGMTIEFLSGFEDKIVSKRII